MNLLLEDVHWMHNQLEDKMAHHHQINHDQLLNVHN